MEVTTVPAQVTPECPTSLTPGHQTAPGNPEWGVLSTDVPSHPPRATAVERLTRCLPKRSRPSPDTPAGTGGEPSQKQSFHQSQEG